MLQVGNHEIYSVINGYCRLDGGAMFGVVPKVLWQKNEDVDRDNRILLAMRTLVAVDRQAGRLILVDTGPGSKWSEEEADRYAIENLPEALPTALQELGFAFSDVTDVVITHAHFDHCGGLTRWQDRPGGATEPAFANARYWVHEKHWQHAHEPSDRDRASFLQRDFEVIEQAGLLNKVVGDEPLPPFAGLRWRLAHGHTPYMLLPWFEDENTPLLFTGDLIPTSRHLRPPWVMAYDLFPLTTVSERKSVLRHCREQGLLLAFPHDQNIGVCSVAFEKKKIKVDQILL